MIHEGILRFLVELRKRLLYCFLSVAFIFLSLIYFSNDIYTLLALPLLKFLPQGHGLIATNIVAPFFVPFELTFVVALFFAMPIFIYQAWAFIAPALYQHEKKLLWPVLIISSLLFYMGLVFAYFVVFPLLFKFLTKVVPQGVWMSPDMTQYLDFTLKLFFVFGLIFEVPIIILVLIRLNITSRAMLVRMRPYAIVGAFVLGMLFAPPDIFSQTVLAVPIWLLYETGIFLARFLEKK